MRRVPSFLCYAALLAGALLTSAGMFVGYATSSTGHYGWLLRFWALATGSASSLFVAVAISIAVGAGWRPSVWGWPHWLSRTTRFTV